MKTRIFGASRLRGWLIGVLAVAAVSVAVSADAGAPYPNLNAKAVDLTNVVRGASGGLVSVIVEFRQPDAARTALESSSTDDVAVTSAVHAAQDKILSDTFGTADSALIAASAPGRHVDRLDISPMFAFSGPLTDVEALAAHPDVVRIHVNRRSKVNLIQSVPFTGMTQPAMSPYTGTNQIIAIIDTGVMKTHKFLAGKVISEACYSNEGVGGARSTCPGHVGASIAVGSGVNCNLAIFGETCGHGTYVAGIAAGRWTGTPGPGIPTRGMAPDAEIIAINATTWYSPDVVFVDSDILHGLERVYLLRNSFLPRKVAAINVAFKVSG